MLNAPPAVENLSVDSFLALVSAPPAVLYFTVVGAAVTALLLAEPTLGHRYLLINLMLCSLLGSVTVLASSAISHFIGHIKTDPNILLNPVRCPPVPAAPPPASARCRQASFPRPPAHSAAPLNPPPAPRRCRTYTLPFTLSPALSPHPACAEPTLSLPCTLSPHPEGAVRAAARADLDGRAAAQAPQSCAETLRLEPGGGEGGRGRAPNDRARVGGVLVDPRRLRRG